MHVIQDFSTSIMMNFMHTLFLYRPKAQQKVFFSVFNFPYTYLLTWLTPLSCLYRVSTINLSFLDCIFFPSIKSSNQSSTGLSFIAGKPLFDFKYLQIHNLPDHNSPLFHNSGEDLSWGFGISGWKCLHSSENQTGISNSGRAYMRTTIIVSKFSSEF